MKFSLFENDPWNRVLHRLPSPFNHRPSLLLQVSYSIAGTWGILGLLAWMQGVALRGAARESFLLDLAAHAQFLVTIPVLLIAEPYLDRQTGAMARHFVRSHLVPSTQFDLYDQTVRKLESVRRWITPDVICLVVAYAATWIWLAEELNNGIPTWHALVGERLTLAGWWAGGVAVPLLQYLLFRWVWKVLLWCWFLKEVSRLNLNIFPAHPDRCGGLGLLGKIQSRFGILLFAVGVMIAATAHHKIVAENGALGSFGVWGPMFFFVVLAPPTFMTPLIFFTRLLANAKSVELLQYGGLISLYAAALRERWLASGIPENVSTEIGADFGGLADAQSAFRVIQSMHIIPFDMASLLRLAASSGGPMIPIVVRLIPVPESLRWVLELFN